MTDNPGGYGYRRVDPDIIVWGGSAGTAYLGGAPGLVRATPLSNAVSENRPQWGAGPGFSTLTRASSSPPAQTSPPDGSGPPLMARTIRGLERDARSPGSRSSTRSASTTSSRGVGGVGGRALRSPVPLRRALDGQSTRSPASPRPDVIVKHTTRTRRLSSRGSGGGSSRSGSTSSMPTSPLPLADDDGNYPGNSNSNSNSNSNDETFVAERRRSSFSMLSDADGHMLSAKESLELIALRARVEHLEVEKSQGQGAGGNASTAAAGGSGGSANNVAAFQAAGAELYQAGMVAGRRASMSEAEKVLVRDGNGLPDTHVVNHESGQVFEKVQSSSGLNVASSNAKLPRGSSGQVIGVASALASAAASNTIMHANEARRCSSSAQHIRLTPNAGSGQGGGEFSQETDLDKVGGGVVLNRTVDRGFGILFGCSNGKTVISGIKEGGCADLHGGLRIGMAVWTINGMLVHGDGVATTKQLQSVIKAVNKTMVLTFAPRKRKILIL